METIENVLFDDGIPPPLLELDFENIPTKDWLKMKKFSVSLIHKFQKKNLDFQKKD